jgi:hypothetical protein
MAVENRRSLIKPGWMIWSAWTRSGHLPAEMPEHRFGGGRSKEGTSLEVALADRTVTWLSASCPEESLRDVITRRGQGCIRAGGKP